MKFSFAPGSRPLDGFTIKRAIHKGGFGEVYHARTDAGKDVAIKLLHKDQEIEKRGVQQCLNLKNTHLISLYDVQTDGDGDTWVVMEYVPGATLLETLQKSPGGLPVKEIERWLTGITLGLDYLHSHGLVHRDLKPANLFQEVDGTVKIGDVGLTKYITQSQRDEQTSSVGTVYYMAPEIANGSYGKEIDVYALGVILYEMLTGEVPFEGETAAEILMKHLTTPPDLSPLPTKLRPVVARALDKDPVNRTRSAGQLLEEFRSAVALASGAAADMVLLPDESASGKELVTATASATKSPKHLPSGTGFPTPSPVAHTGTGSSALKVLTLGLLVVGFTGLVGGSIREMSLLAGGILLLFVGPSLLPGRPRQSREPQPKPTTCTVRTPGTKRVRWHAGPGRLTPETARTIPLAERVFQTSTSLLLSTAVVVGLSAVTLWLTALQSDTGAIIHFVTVAILAAWGILAFGKLTEGVTLAPFTRRMLLFGVGAAVGLAGYGLQEFLLVPSDVVSVSGKDVAFRSVGVQPLISADRQPTLLAYIIFFGGLLSLRRWWWHTDSLRRRKFKLTSVALTTLLAFCLVSMFAFPVAPAILWACVVSCSVQASSGWMSLEDRVRLTEATT